MEIVAFKNRVTGLIAEIVSSMDGAFLPCYESHGLTAAQLRVLAAVRPRQPVGVDELGRCIGMATANVSSLCRRLERAGLLQRRRGERDERLVYLSLTEAGERELQCVDALLRRYFMPVLERQPEEDLNAILAGLERLAALTAELKAALPAAMPGQTTE